MSRHATDHSSIWLRIIAALLTLVFAVGALAEDPQTPDRNDDGVSSVVPDTGSDSADAPTQWKPRAWSMLLRERHSFALRDLPTESAHTSTSEVLRFAPKRPPPAA